MTFKRQTDRTASPWILTAVFVAAGCFGGEPSSHADAGPRVDVEADGGAGGANGAGGASTILGPAGAPGGDGGGGSGGGLGAGGAGGEGASGGGGSLAACDCAGLPVPAEDDGGLLPRCEGSTLISAGGFSCPGGAVCELQLAATDCAAGCNPGNPFVGLPARCR